MLRKLTVDIKVEAQCADDSLLAPLVAEALQEFIAATNENSKIVGKFESKRGLDVSWSAKNEYFDDKGKPVPKPIAAAVGVAAHELAKMPTEGSA